MTSIQSISLTIVLVFYSSLGFSKEIRLFGADLFPVSDYHHLIVSLQSGDELVFSDGKRFRFVAYAGHGNSAHVLKVEGGWVLRVPFFDGRYLGSPQELADYFNKMQKMQEFKQGMELLGTTTLPIPQMETSRNRATYQVVEDLDIGFRLDELLASLGWLRADAIDPEALRRWGGQAKGQDDRRWLGRASPMSDGGNQAGSVPDFLQKTYLKKLGDFLEKAWELTDVGDFRASQVGWSKKYKDFRLMDATDSASFFADEKDDSLLEALERSWQFPPEFLASVRRRILLRRRDATASGRICWVLF